MSKPILYEHTIYRPGTKIAECSVSLELQATFLSRLNVFEHNKRLNELCESIANYVLHIATPDLTPEMLAHYLKDKYPAVSLIKATATLPDTGNHYRFDFKNNTPVDLILTDSTTVETRPTNRELYDSATAFNDIVDLRDNISDSDVYYSCRIVGDSCVIIAANSFSQVQDYVNNALLLADSSVAYSGRMDTDIASTPKNILGWNYEAVTPEGQSTRLFVCDLQNHPNTAQVESIKEICDSALQQTCEQQSTDSSKKRWGNDFLQTGCCDHLK